MIAQLELFPPPPRRDDRDIKHDLAFSPAVEEEIMAVFAANPGEWLAYGDFWPLINKHAINCWLGHVLYHLADEGKLQETRVYYGSENIGPDYQGFQNKYKLPGEVIQ